VSRVEVSNTITTAPVTQVIEKGTKPKVTTPSTSEKEETVTEAIPYTTETVENPNLEEGITRVQTAGKNGVRSITYKVTYDASGKEVSRVEVSNTITTAPVTQVIEKGTKAKTTTTTTEKEEVETIPYETETIDDPNLPVGTTKVQREGQNGSQTITYQIITDSAGHQLEKKEIHRKVTKQPVKKVILRGTKEKLIDKKQLETLVHQAETYTQPSYTTDSWNGLKQSLQKAKQVLTNPKATQEEVTQSANELQQSITQLKKKESVPTVQLTAIDPNIDQKTATVHYQVTDQDHTLQSIKVKVSQGQAVKEEKTVDIKNPVVLLNNLAYNTPYTLETVYTYVINQQTITKEQKEKETIELVPKKLEISNFNALNLYKVNANGTLTNLIGLSEKPKDLQNYMVKVDSVTNKDLLLPVHDIQEIQENGVAKYKVIISYPELVTYNPKTNDFVDHYSFTINKIVHKANEYTDFKQLVDAINQNPTGTFTIGSDLSASEVTTTEGSYITKEFSGTLQSEAGKAYTIYNLSHPLFNTIKNGTVKNIHLMDVSITGHQSEVGSLAKIADHATIENVHAQGNISVPINIGGLVYMMKNTSTIKNSSFNGSIILTSDQNYFVGGLVGILNDQSKIDTSYAVIDINASAYRNDNKIGGLVGQSYSNTLIENSYVTGQIKNNGSGGFVGGIIGSAWWNGHLKNVISSVKVDGGNIIHGDTGYTNAPFTNVYYVKDQASGKSNSQAMGITKSGEEDFIKKWNIKLNNISHHHVTLTDYSQLDGYQKDREIAYRNVEKLIPLYDRYTILHYGNLVPTNSKLYTTKVLSVTPAKDHQIITDVFNDLNKVNQLLIHYSDGTVEWVTLANPSTFKNTKLVEFKLGNQLIYTPMQFQSTFNELLKKVEPAFNKVTFLSPDMLQKFGFMWTADEVKKAQDQAVDNYKKDSKNPSLTNEKEKELRAQAEKDLQTSKYNKLKDMYLWESFDAIKKNLNEELRSILVNGTVVDVDSAGISNYLTHKLEEQAVNILLGLAYVNRLYNIQYGDVNIKNLAMYRTDFYGANRDTMDWLSSLGNMGYESLQVKNNYTTYSNQFSSLTGQSNLIDYLDYNRRLFVPTMDENQWFKAATKAYIYEAPSKEVPTADVQTYSRLKGKYREEYRNFILPLLNLKSNDVFVVTNMSTITFGLYERYIDEALKKTPEKYAQKVKEFEKTLNHFGDMWAGYYDTWYRIVDEKVKSQLYTRDIPVWDGYWIIDNTQKGYWKNRWVGPYDESVPGMTEFFGAIGKWYDPNGTGAYANGSLVHFVVDAVVTNYGTSTLTHEMTHNFDGGIYFNGYGRRDGVGAESFAMGLLQSPDSQTSSVYGLNLVYNWPDNSLRSQNYSPSIFKSDQDLGHYMHGVFDVTYLLDYAEAEVSLAKNKDDQKLLYRKLESTDGTDKVVEFTNEEWNSMDLKTVDDLIDKNVVAKRYYDKANVDRNSYYEISMYAPIYAGLQNSNGSSGGIIFRKSAYELLADKGWTQGFIPYVSDQYKETAKTENKTFSDQFIVGKIFGTKYTDYAAFKKAMFKERIDKKEKLKEITIKWEGKQERITSYDSLLKLFKEALDKDIALAKSKKDMHYLDDLKSQVMQAYHLLTNDFKDSIFK
ncbi:ZmpA/ZmpB/ZmpC family metallo-endopeptidase, partial [Enterococcus faecium]|uniref:ZmpA/ZmpB/ZmpC family metallo-endopeptidase n=1 Tax=Enterococcus faecium TaxID=1352 RepID=UPI001910CF7F